MKCYFSKKFQKSFSKLSSNNNKKAMDKIHLFSQKPNDDQLRNHSLSGKYSKYRSINITGDIRAVYKITDPKNAMFIDIGTHSKLYK
jgi:mRNA interferase YafQ